MLKNNSNTNVSLFIIKIRKYIKKLLSLATMRLRTKVWERVYKRHNLLSHIFMYYILHVLKFTAFKQSEIKGDDLINIEVILWQNLSRNICAVTFDNNEKDKIDMYIYALTKHRAAEKVIPENYYVLSYLSSQKVHGVCNGMPEPSCFSIVLTVSSDKTSVFNRSVEREVLSFVSHSAAAMFETTMQPAACSSAVTSKSCDRSRCLYHRRRRVASRRRFQLIRESSSDDVCRLKNK